MRLIVLLVTMLAVSGCKSATTRYLEEAKGHATQDDVVQRFGPPYAERALGNGSSVWSYRSNRCVLQQRRRPFVLRGNDFNLR